jgi:hypothetical protein
VCVCVCVLTSSFCFALLFCSYDILAAGLTFANNLLTERFKAFVLPVKSAADGEEGVEEVGGERHEIFENASLGDLHCLIDWIASYQITLKAIKCPVASNNSTSTVATASSWLSGTCKHPKSCGLFDLMPRICNLYVHGGSAGAKVRFQILC